MIRRTGFVRFQWRFNRDCRRLLNRWGFIAFMWAVVSCIFWFRVSGVIQ